MNQSFCVYENNRDQTIVAYLYDDIAPQDRAAFERHLLECAMCRDELTELRGVRHALARWSPPTIGSIFTSARSAGSPSTSAATWWWNVPVWAQVAAAMLCLGVGAGLANFRVAHDAAGWTMSTGWFGRSATARANGGAEPAVATRAELTALDQRLRAELQTARASAAPQPAAAVKTGDEEIARRVRGMIRESEQRQQRELALRVAEVAREVQAQRQADLVRIDRTLGVLQSNTGMAVRRQEQLLNSLAVRVSQRQ